MAKFRTNHNKKSKKESSGMVIKVGMFAALLGLLYWGFQKFSGEAPPPEEPVATDVERMDSTGSDSIFYLPLSSTGSIVRHQFYA
ncbi:MAG: hypothetical protein HY842_01340, partial [Bacteroidetes bacterium]|nr:hypothetical protein [Bacteroidota bacterium]